VENFKPKEHHPADPPEGFAFRPYKNGRGYECTNFTIAINPQGEIACLDAYGKWTIFSNIRKACKNHFKNILILDPFEIFHMEKIYGQINPDRR
jgi:hypothetical protein